MPHAYTHILPGKPQSVTSQEHLNHFGDSGGGCLWALLLILRLLCFPPASFPTVSATSLHSIQSAHDRAQSCPGSSVPIQPFCLSMDSPFSSRLCSGFSCFSPSPHVFLIPCNAVFIFFLHALLCHLHSSMSLGFSYACSSPALAGSSFSKGSCESEECK